MFLFFKIWFIFIFFLKSVMYFIEVLYSLLIVLWYFWKSKRFLQSRAFSPPPFLISALWLEFQKLPLTLDIFLWAEIFNILPKNWRILHFACKFCVQGAKYLGKDRKFAKKKKNANTVLPAKTSEKHRKTRQIWSCCNS